MSSGWLPFDRDDDNADARIVARDRAARERAVDPRVNVALEASAGTGKTRVLVDRYINLLRAGVDPANILAMTFTRKAAGEMRDRIMSTLRAAAARGEIPLERWRDLRDRTADIGVSTIDAFCLSLLREFPLEADIDPGFSVADETELPRLVDESLDRTLRLCRAAARDDENVALVLGQLGERRTRAALATLLDRRLVAPAVLRRYLAGGAADLESAGISHRAAAALLGMFESMHGGMDRFLESGPLEPAFELLARSLRAMSEALRANQVTPRAVGLAFARAREHFLTQEGTPRSRSPYPQRAFANATDWRTHTAFVTEYADAFAVVDMAYRRDLNVLLARGMWRMFHIAEAEYLRTLDGHALLDFSDLIQRTLDLLRRMEEFSRSRYRLESRYHHVLVDEFQDTSRAQWELVSLLVQSWREGSGLTDTGPLLPSIFIVGDRKQSIYGFRDADVSVLREAARYIGMLRPDRDVSRSISRSFRAQPALLAFVNDVCGDMDKGIGDSAFQYEDEDRFPVEAHKPLEQGTGLGVALGGDSDECAEITASEITRVLSAETEIHDRHTGLKRPARPGDIAILFRSRDSHREFEAALARRGVPSYVYKGLGFFDSDEIKDALALIHYLADPASDLRAAALMRSRFFGISDEALRRLAPALADALIASEAPAAIGAIDAPDAKALAEARVSLTRWRALVDRIGPAELIDLVLAESAYAFELRGTRFQRARENLKKLRALLRRLQNRGYTTLSRVAEHLDRVAVGDEANAVIDAFDAVNLMTIHASKGLEFPIVFVVNLTRGTGTRRNPVRWSPDQDASGPSVAVGDFQPETDNRLNDREREETKRLVYVALTRARDQLYLATTRRDGQVTPSRGSLAEVMPPSLLQLLGTGAIDVLPWRASSGVVHHLRVCSMDDLGLRRSPATAVEANAPDAPQSDFSPLSQTASSPRTAASMVRHDAESSAPRRASESDRLVGILVHRMLQRFGTSADLADIGTDAILDLLHAADLAHRPTDSTAADLVDRALVAYRSICGRRDVRDLYTAGERLHEVPFTMRLDDGIVRGTIDCLVRTAPDRMALLEFKTGRSREQDRLQLDVYRQAAERLFPGVTIDARLVYAEGAS